MELRELARDVYACLQPDRGLGTSNSGLLNRGGGLVVDTFWDLPHTRQMIDPSARVWKAPARRVVNTHRNGDHCWGNQLFPDAEIIGHRLCAAEFGKERPEFMQTLRNSGSSSDPAVAAFARRLADWDFAGIELRPPKTLIDERLTLDLDGIHADLIDVGPYAGWTEPERIVFQVERAYRELRGEPFDAPIDVTPLFGAMYELAREQRH